MNKTISKNTLSAFIYYKLWDLREETFLVLGNKKKRHSIWKSVLLTQFKISEKKRNQRKQDWEEMAQKKKRRIQRKGVGLQGKLEVKREGSYFHNHNSAFLHLQQKYYPWEITCSTGFNKYFRGSQGGIILPLKFKVMEKNSFPMEMSNFVNLLKSIWSPLIWWLNPPLWVSYSISGYLSLASSQD